MIGAMRYLLFALALLTLAPFLAIATGAMDTHPQGELIAYRTMPIAALTFVGVLIYRISVRPK